MKDTVKAIKQRTPELTSVITFRVKPEERLHLEEQAGIAGLSLSDYIRRRALGRRVVASADAAMLRELRRIGGLLKHIYSESGVYSRETAAALDAVRDYIKRLSRDREENTGKQS